MVTRADLESNLRAVRDRIAAAAARAGRSPQEVTVMAVTKGHPAQALRLAVQSGLRVIGENRVQEAESKIGEAPEGCELHLIGHLQRNKARKAVRLFRCVHSIDAMETAIALGRAAADAAKTVDVLLEKNTSGAETQSGYRDAGRLLDDLAAIAGLPGLRVRGLMTIAPLTGDEARVRRAFAELREVFERARRQLPGLDVLSMGMSNDYEPAVEEGATIVRLGTALFGARTDA
jgi:pyridoxal phosphate enzyme (YggS family)